MLYGIKRMDDHDNVAIHIVDPESGRGLIFYFGDGPDFVKVENIYSRNIYPYLIENGYYPQSISDREFYDLYKECLLSRSRVLHIDIDELDLNDYPLLKSIIEYEPKLL